MRHSPEGWADALTKQAATGPSADPDVLEAVRGYRTSEAAHLSALVDLYRG